MGGTVSSFVDTGLNAVSGGLWDKATGGGSGNLISRLVGSAISAVQSQKKKDGPPELDVAAQAERNEAAEAERKRRLVTGRASTTLTGGLGDTSAPTLASKVLLGA